MPGASCLRRAASVSVFSLLLAVTALTAWNFPRTTDPVAARTVADADYRAFYERSYSAHPAVAETCRAGTGRSCEARPEEAPDAERSLVADQVRAFVKAYRLEEKRILDVGSGSGELQDMVRDYTGLDISAAAARFYHKPFVQGSATEMPFPDNSFDAIWTIYVLEHVPQPEKALYEMRRVLKPDGYLYLRAAWQARSWASGGYAVRPFSDFGLWGKLVKASVPVRDSGLYRALHTMPIRALRLSYAVASRRPTALRYNELEPDYEHYWTADADAVNSMDAFEAVLWFTSRGDECLNYSGLLRQFTIRGNPLVLRIRKP